MTIIRLNDGNLFLHSPVKLDSELKRALNALGPVGAVVAPNRAHHLFVRDYIESYPQAKSYGAPGVPEKRPDLRLDATLGDEAPREWQGVIDSSSSVAHQLSMRLSFFTHQAEQFYSRI